MKITDPLNKLPLLSGKSFQKMEGRDDYFIPRESRDFTGAILSDNGNGTFTLEIGNFSQAVGTLPELQENFNFSIPK